MAGAIRYPAGAPAPHPQEPLDDLLQRQQAGIRRVRSPFEPPPGIGPTPRVVPRSLFRKAQSEDILTFGQSLAAKHDALDLAFNAEADATRERISGFTSLESLMRPEERSLEPAQFHVRYLQQRTTAAVSQMNRMKRDATEVWTPPPHYVGTLTEEDQDRALEYYGVIAARAGWTYKSGVEGAPGDIPIYVPRNYGELERRQADFLQRSQNVGLVLAGPGESAWWLARAGHAVGSAFDGKGFWRSVWVNGGATVAAHATSIGLGHGDYERYRAEAEKSFDKYWNDMPREAQLFAEELNPGNVALALVGGPMAKVLKASGTPGARLMGSLIEPLAANPAKAVAYQVGANVATRSAYERTEGAPGFVRVVAAGAAGIAVVGLPRAARAAFDSFQPEAIEPSLRALVEETAERPVDRWRKNIIDVTPDTPASALPPGSIVRIDGMTARVTEEGEFARFYLGPEPGVANTVRADRVNIARGRSALLSRMDMEVRMGGLAPDEAAVAREFIEELPPGYLNTLGSSFVKDLDPDSVRSGVEGGATLMGSYDPARMVVSIAKNAVRDSADPGGTMIHEIAHHLEQFVPARTAAQLVEQYRSDLALHGRGAIAEFDAATARAKALKETIDADPLAATTEMRNELHQLNNERARLQARAYRYRSFQEWFAENIADRVAARRNRAAPTSAVGRAAEAVRDMADAMATALKRVGGFETVEDAFRKLSRGEYDPAQARNLLDLYDEPIDELAPIVGFARASDAPLPVRSALGDGGVIKAGHHDEVLDPLTDEIMESWRGDLLRMQVLPSIRLRTQRPGGSKLTPIPDILPVARPTTARNVVSTNPQPGGPNVATLGTAELRAADLAAQQGGTVPSGIMHSIQRAYGVMAHLGHNRVMNFLNQASNSNAVRQGIVAERMVRGEFAARIAPSRAQFLGRVKELFGSTDKLPERIQYVGPTGRPLAGGTVLAGEHPLTGTILDYLENPGFYSEPISKYLPEFVAYDKRNTAVSQLLKDEFGVDIGDYGAVTAGHVFVPNYDAGVGRVARGHDVPIVSAGSSFHGRTYPTMTARLAEPDQVLTEPVTDIAEIFSRLDMQKMQRAQLEAFRYSVGGSLRPVDGWKEVEPFERLTDKKVWLPKEEADAAAEWLTSRELAPFNWMENFKNTHLGADFSPLTIQGAVGWALSPVDNTRDMLWGLARGMEQGITQTPVGHPGLVATGIFRPFTNEALFQDMAAAPERWMRFFTYMGQVPAGGTPAEWRTGFLEKLPLVGGHIASANDGVTNALVRGMESTFNEFGTMLMARGWADDEAWGAAADMMKMGWLQQNFDQLGIEPTRRSIERGSLISTTFVRQPINFVDNVLTGFAKLAASPARMAGTAGQWTNLTPREMLAVHFGTKMVGTFTGIAAVSAVITADERGWTPAEALERAVLDVGGPDWMTLWFNKDLKIPLGGPYRALARAAAPQPFGGYENVPFGGIPEFIQSRITSGVQLGLQLRENEDFRGHKIYTEGGIKGLAQAIGYTAANTIPVFLGQPIEAVLDDRSLASGFQAAAWQFMGMNPLVASEYETLERERRIGARALYNMEDKSSILSPEQQVAARDSQSLSQLRRVIGTRAADAAVALANPAVGGAQDAYISDLERRADKGDRDAEALLGSVRTQEALEALAETSKVDGVLDKTLYRLGRGEIIDREVGRSEAFRDVFDKMRESDSAVDRASTEWYALFDKATRYVTIAGEQRSAGVDYEAFNQMEDEFYAGLGTELASLVQQNINVAPQGGTAIEQEYRDVRGELALSGYWDIDEELWQQAKGRFDKSLSNLRAQGRDVSMPPELIASVLNSSSFTEFRLGVERHMTKLLINQHGFVPETAIQVAKSEFQRLPDADAWDKAMIERKADWAEKHADDGLAEKAIQWGYLSDSIRNLMESGTLERAREQRQQRAPTPTPTPQRRSAVPPTTLNDRLFAEHEAGSSYGALAVRYNMSRDAVRSRIRNQQRRYDEAGAVATFERGDDGRISGITAAPMRILRDEDGRPVGIGRAV